MKNVLVFGGTRFFGRRLVELLIQNGHNVTIATRGKSLDNFGSKINRLILDRENIESIGVIKNTHWDIVYDNICYSSQAAMIACESLQNNVGKYIFTSTLSVYDEGDLLDESDFNPYTYNYIIGDRHAFDYKEGKRNAEAYFFQKAPFIVIAPRFPIVLDEDDYTERLVFHITQVKNLQPISADDFAGEMCFISANEAAEFLYWLMDTDFEGPINACSNGFISLNEIIALIETNTKTIALTSQNTQENLSPFNGMSDYKLSNKKAEELGFKFKNVNAWMKELIEFKT
ncbi:MAG: dependent epimerase/dehydratase family protein [Bacillales bacterium]|jgi:nucleoside-diphosphate-sugar epimerase|nr:dependent epimerase/dehydratase family protein [Bacillales bacterium]